MSLRLVFGWILVTVAPLAAETPKIEVVKHRNLAYNSATDADPVRHKLDLYLPKGVKNYPVMVFVHGGSWKSGNKDLYPALGNTFAEQGIGTAIINYRLSGSDGKVKHPDHIHDVAKAFAWVKNNIAKYDGRADKLFLSGHSAGGHLVALLAVDDRYLKAEKCKTTDIAGVMALSGVYSINPAMTVFTKAFGTDAESCKSASPISHVSGKHPPFLVAYGDKDLPLLDLMAVDFSKKLGESKCECELMKCEKRDHFTIIINLASSAEDPLTKKMIEYVKKH